MSPRTGLAPLRPATPEVAPESAPAMSSPPGPSMWDQWDLGFYAQLLSRYIWHICAAICISVMATFLVVINLTKKYEAIALVQVDPTGIQVTDGNGLDQQRGTEDLRGRIATEVNVITSPAVVEQAIQALHLERVPEIAAAARKTHAPEDADQAILKKVTSEFNIAQPLDTWLLEVHARANSPELAAELANGLSQAFLDHEYATRTQTLDRTSQYMVHQLDGLRAQMESSQKALVDYSRQYNIQNPDSGDNILQARLADLNQAAGKVQSARIQYQAEADTAGRGGLDALLVSNRGADLLPLYNRLLADRRQLDQLAQTEGPDHPVRQQQAALVARDQAVLESAEQRVQQQIEDQYRSAVSQEQLFGEALLQQKQAINDFDLKAIQFRALKAKADSYSKLYYDLQQRIQQANLESGFRSEDMRIISAAHPVNVPVAPTLGLDLILALLGSLVVSVGIALAVGVSDQTITSPEAAERWLHVSALAALPNVSLRADPEALAPGPHLLGDSITAEQSSVLQQNSPFWESVVSLHSAISFGNLPQPTVLALTSTQPSEGKSTVASNLASAFAIFGLRTVLVDADLRKPSVHRLLRLRNSIGLSNVLRQQIPLDQALQVTAVGGLTVLTAGPACRAPSELLHHQMAEVLDQLRASFDVILVDCPPTIGFADAPLVANLADAAILLLHAGKTPRAMIMAAIRTLRAARVNLMGLVLNRVDERAGAYYSGQYYSTYYAEESSED